MKTPRKSGFTLTEVLIATALGGVIIAGVMSTFLMMTRSSVRVAIYQRLEQESTLGLERLGRDLRMAEKVESAAGTPITSITLTLPELTGTSSHTVNYTYVQNTGRFVRTEGGVTRTLIANIVPGTFSFNRFNLLQAEASNDYETNQIQIQMVASANNRGLVAAASKRVISARYVLRNR